MPPNFRDVGVYAISPTKHLRNGIAFRSASCDDTHITKMTRLCQDLNIGAIFDLRNTAQEIVASLPHLPVIRLPAINKFEHNILQSYFSELEKDPVKAVTDLYIYISDNSKPAFRAIFQYVRDNPYKPFLVHCELGKDRTGVFIALLFFVLQVDERDIVDDYELSQRGIQPLIPRRKAKLLSSAFMATVSTSPRALENHFSIVPGVMQRFLDHIGQTYKSGEGYFESLGLPLRDLQVIRSHMTLDIME